MNKFTWAIFAIITIGVFGYFINVGISSDTKINLDNIDIAKYQAATLQGGQIADHYKGNIDSKIVVVEYGDYQCSACLTQFPITNAVYEEYKDDILMIFRNYPITGIHPNAKIAAVAAEAAGLQGKYWEMHDKLYNRQSDWSTASSAERLNEFTKLATEIGLDVDKFKSDINSQDILQKIKFDQAMATKAGIIGTPSFYLNGVAIDGKITSSISEFKDFIAKEIEKQANN